MTQLVQLHRNLAQADDSQIGQALTALYRDAQQAELAILRFGAAFHAVEELVSGTRAGNSPERGPGSYGFESWLRDHAPDVSPRTARRYRDIARATAEKFRIENPVEVFSLPEEELSEADRVKRAKVVEFVSDKSMRGIQLELGLRHVPKGGNLGGRRPKAELPSPEQAVAARIAYNQDWYRDNIQNWRTHLLEQQSYQDLPDVATRDGELTLDQFVHFVETVAEQARAILKARSKGRAVA